MQQQSLAHRKILFDTCIGPVKSPQPDAPKLFSQSLKALLRKRGQQAALAKSVGVSEGVITAWKKGSGGHNPGLDKLGAIAAHFGVPVADLFRGAESGAAQTTQPNELGRDTVDHAVREDSSHVVEARLLKQQADLLQAIEQIGRIANRFIIREPRDRGDHAQSLDPATTQPATRRGHRRHRSKSA